MRTQLTLVLLWISGTMPAVAIGGQSPAFRGWPLSRPPAFFQADLHVSNSLPLAAIGILLIAAGLLRRR